VNLSASETRVLGCLLEKQRTTPDTYPLSLNALRLACNQATNRDPVVEYDDGIIRDALHRLERRGLARLASGRGSRATKYRHLLAEALPMNPAEQALMCVLMLRGPQTPGQLKQRGERMHSFAHLEEVQETLARLIERQLVARLHRRPGQKEERYTQLLAVGAGREGEPEHVASAAGGDFDGGREFDGSVDLHATSAMDAVPGAARAEGALTGLQARVARLEREVAELREVQQSAQHVELPL
jgi:uncharacterized protein